MKRFFLLTLCCIALCSSVFAQSYLPTSNGEIVEHTYYTLSYVEAHEQAEWVYYTITPASLVSASTRSDNFRADPKVSTKSASLDDYKSSGYDRGHLCPAASMSHNQTAMSESFFLSNMSPQLPSFNRGAWKNLEEHVRKLGLIDSVLHVITGPIFTDPIGSIGDNEVTVPRHYYKVIYSPKKCAMIAFVMENSKLDGSLYSYAQSVDSVEVLTGVDFFAQFSHLESLEASYNTEIWSVDTSSSVAPAAVIPAPAPDEQKSESTQCQAITSSGKQCTRTAQSGSSYCWQHQK